MSESLRQVMEEELKEKEILEALFLCIPRKYQTANIIISKKDRQVQIFYDHKGFVFDYYLNSNGEIRFLEKRKRNDKTVTIILYPKTSSMANKVVKTKKGVINGKKELLAMLGMVLLGVGIASYQHFSKKDVVQIEKTMDDFDLDQMEQDVVTLTTAADLETELKESESMETKDEVEPSVALLSETKGDIEETTSPFISPTEKFYDVPCSAELQHYIYQKCLECHVPFRIVMTIGHQESNGNWNNSGVISSTEDYGVMQINIINMKTLYDKFKKEGESYQEFLHSMQYDDYRNIDCSIDLISAICKMYDKEDYENIFGTYNGWKNWKEKGMSRNYVEKTSDYYNNLFVPLEFDETENYEKETGYHL